MRNLKGVVMIKIKKTLIVLTVVMALLLSISLSAEEMEFEDERVIKFEPVIILATRLPMKTSDIPFDVEYVEGDEIDVGENLSDILEKEEGIDVLSYGGQGSLKTLSIRGSGSTQSLVMMDTIPMNSTYDGSVDFNLLSTTSVHHIELIKGPVSALYGANALGGVINIVSNPFYRSPDKDYHISFESGFGSFGEMGFNTTTGVRIEPVTVSATVSGEESDGFRPNSDHKRSEMRFNVGIDGSDGGEFQVNSSLVESELGVIGSFSNPDETARERDDLKFLGLSHDIDISSYFSLSTNFSVKGTHRNYTSELYGHSETDSDLMTYNLGLNGTLKFDRLYISNAFEITDDKVDLYSTSLDDEQVWELRNYGYSFQTSYIADILSLVGGMRLDHSGQWGDFISPRIGSSFEVVDGFNLYSSYSRGFRAPTMTELYWPEDPIYGGGGNPDLVPEKSHSFEAGLKVDREVGSTTLNAGTTIFYQKVEDLISGWPPENVNRATIKGIELSLGMNLPYGFSTSLNHTYQRCVDGDGVELYYRPDNKFYTTVEHTFSINPISVSNEFELSFVGQRRGWYNDEYFQRQEVELDSYKLLNYSLNFGISLFEFMFRIENLTGEEYQEIADYPMPGREYHFGIGLEM